MSQVKKVLLVDDDADFVQINKSALSKAGYNVVAAYDGKECLRKVHTEKPDVIVLDLMMATWSEGFDVAETLRGAVETRDIPIILVTAVNMDNPLEAEPGLRSLFPANEYMAKPVEPEELVGAVKRALSHKA
ncbi:MAG: response regulator [Candidatus Brocadiia bacterium]